MVNKNTLIDFINKYYLGGINNTVKWVIKDNVLQVNAGISGRVCQIKLKNFTFENTELGIFDTNKLLKLISVTQGELLVSTEKQKSLNTKLHIADLNYDVVYSLGDTLIMEKAPWYEVPKDEFSFEVDLTEHFNNIIKGISVLSEVDNVIISTTSTDEGNTMCQMVFGDNTGYSNKISYKMDLLPIKEVGDISLPFSSTIIKEILNNNKDAAISKMLVSTEGMVKFEFDNEETQSIYFVARNE